MFAFSLFKSHTWSCLVGSKSEIFDKVAEHIQAGLHIHIRAPNARFGNILLDLLLLFFIHKKVVTRMVIIVSIHVGSSFVLITIIA